MTSQHKHHGSLSTSVQLALSRSSQSYKEGQGIIKDHMIGASTISLVPFPIFDALAIINIQLNLIHRLANHYGVPSLSALPRTLISSTIIGSLPVLIVAAGSSVLKIIPGFGHLAGSITLSILANAATYATGKVFLDHFASGGTLNDFCPEAFRRQFRLEFQRKYSEGMSRETTPANPAV